MTSNPGTPITELPFEVRHARVEFDLVAISVTSAVTALDRIKKGLKTIYDRSGPEGIDVSEAELASIFSDAWVIVDRLDMLRRVLAPKLNAAPESANFAALLSMLQAVRSVRNKMDHVDAKQIAKKTSGPDYPILGVITAAMFDQSQIINGEIHYIDSIVISHSDFHHKINLNAAPDSFFPISPPVDHIRLHAFDNVLDLTKIVYAAVESTNVLEKRRINAPTSDTRFKVILRASMNPPWRLA